MWSDAIKCGRFVLPVSIFLAIVLQNHVHASESQSAAGNAFSKIKPASQKARPSFNIRKRSTLTKVRVTNKVKRFGKLSLILSTELTNTGKLSVPSKRSSRAVNKPQDEVAKNPALNELNAQIAALEATIKAQQSDLGIDSSGQFLSERMPRGVDSANQSNKQVSRNVRSDVSEVGSVPQLGAEGKSGWLKFGLVVVILVAVLGIFWMRKRKAEPLETDGNERGAIKIKEAPEDIQGPESLPSENTEGSQLLKHPVEDGEKNELQSILPPEYEMLEEADIYLRFGHDKLAEDALREAIKINPQNPQAYLTLLRICFSRDDADGFLELAKQIKPLADENIWSKVTEMGKNMDEENSLYQ